MKEHWLQWALKEGDASGVGEPGPVLQPAVEGGVDPLLAVWLGQALPLQWRCCSAAWLVPTLN